MRALLRFGLATCLVVGFLACPLSAQDPQNSAVKVHDPADLEVGKVAPDIEATDLDTVAFKLSDYRGKIVVLDFWGDW